MQFPRRMSCFRRQTPTLCDFTAYGTFIHLSPSQILDAGYCGDAKRYLEYYATCRLELRLSAVETQTASYKASIFCHRQQHYDDCMFIWK